MISQFLQQAINLEKERQGKLSKGIPSLTHFPPASFKVFLVQEKPGGNFGQVSMRDPSKDVKAFDSYVMRCAIWYHLYNSRNVKNTHEGVLTLVKLQASEDMWCVARFGTICTI